MSYNLFIAYDLMSPGQSYDKVRKAIEELGVHWQFQYSLYWVNTQLTASEAYARVAAQMDLNDRLAVIDAAQGVVSNWDHPPIAEINAIWASR